MERINCSTQFGCDLLLPDPNLVLLRAIEIFCSPAVVFRWLTQLKYAPYSYDWLDNFGRASPRFLLPGLDTLRVGDTVMTIFRLASYQLDRELTIVLPSGSLPERLFGSIAISYRVESSPSGSFLSCKIACATRTTPLGALGRAILPWGDLFMMKRQFQELKRLSERDTQR